ncbi:MAG: NAD(+)/NADH kinase [Chloroflexota bacterium]|nr:NAD(+)/NADH kinase [Chloroflexota bacterium]
MRKRVGLLYHPLVPASQRMAEELVALVEECGYEAWVESAWAREQIVERADHCGLLVTFGGDGTILRVVRASVGAFADGQRGTPLLLTVNYGTLGFLSELSPEQAASGLRRVLFEGEYWIEERNLLRAVLLRDGERIAEQEALNDVVLARGDGPHAIRLALFVDDAEIGRYTADAMIVASPTGSTAYAQGAGGPVLGPDVAGLVVVPVAPHFAFARSFVIPSSSHVMLQASTRKTTVVTIDGQINLVYEDGDQLHVSQSDSVARFIRMGPKNYFYASFREKLRQVL